MIWYIIPLLDSFFTLEFVKIWFYPIFALGFLATLPCFLHSIFRRK